MSDDVRIKDLANTLASGGITTIADLEAWYSAQDDSGVGGVTAKLSLKELLNVYGKTMQGFWDYNDATTAVTPISVTASTPTVLTNDGAGAFTLKTYKPLGLTEIFNTSTNAFDFSELQLGDIVAIRTDMFVTTTAASQEINVYLDLAQGTASNYQIAFSNSTVKTLGATAHLNGFNLIYMGNTDTLNNPAQFKIMSPNNCTVVVTGWAVKVERRSL